MKNQGIVVGIGEILWDLLPGGKQIGGAPANFAYHISQFGLPGCAVSAVGTDALGRELLGTLSSRGLDCLIEEVPYPTGTVAVEVDSNGVPQYDIRENVAWDHIPFTPALEALASATRAVCFGSLAQRGAESGDTIRRFLDAMPRTHESLVVFDANLRQSYYDTDILADSMRRADILKINDEELDVVSRLFGLPAATPRRQCRDLLARFGLTGVILTCGVNGSYVFSGGDESFLPTPAVEVADTVGAGDSFTAAFVASILRGHTMAEAHRRAVSTSAYVCTCRGAMPRLPAGLIG